MKTEAAAESRLEQKPELLPLGSVVTLGDDAKRYMVVARGIAYPVDGRLTAYDYGLCAHPWGITDERLRFADHSDVSDVLFRGFDDEASQAFGEELLRRLAAVRERAAEE